jgi:hypothetical protein
LGAFLSSKLGGVLGVVWGVLWRQVQLFSVAKCCAKVGRHMIRVQVGGRFAQYLAWLRD